MTDAKHVHVECKCAHQHSLMQLILSFIVTFKIHSRVIPPYITPQGACTHTPLIFEDYC